VIKLNHDRATSLTDQSTLVSVHIQSHPGTVVSVRTLPVVARFYCYGCALLTACLWILRLHTPLPLSKQRCAPTFKTAQSREVDERLNEKENYYGNFLAIGYEEKFSRCNKLMTIRLRWSQNSCTHTCRGAGIKITIIRDHNVWTPFSFTALKSKYGNGK
jgi:hypothetical protein